MNWSCMTLVSTEYPSIPWTFRYITDCVVGSTVEVGSTRPLVVDHYSGQLVQDPLQWLVQTVTGSTPGQWDATFRAAT